MKQGLIRELRNRGMVQDIMPGTEEQLDQEPTVGYAGYDPTAASLHIGNLATIMLLVHLQRFGHRPVGLVGGATGMIGDPSGKSEERKLLSEDVLRHNEACIRKQLSKFLDFDTKLNPAEVVNNYDWFKDFSLLRFLREVGKHLTVNYMATKDSVKSRLDTGISFTEFSYQLIQGYDFYWLYKHKNCRLQAGGSDQWGNITAGSELIRRMDGGEAYAFTCPLITRKDGSKFGKSEGENVWLDPEMTSPYKFYQFWLNREDDEVKTLIRKFTLLPLEELEALEQRHDAAPHERLLQKTLAEDVTVRVHSRDDYEHAVKTSEFLFGKPSAEALARLSEQDLKDIFEGVPVPEITQAELQSTHNVAELVSSKTGGVIFPSKGEAVRMIKGGGLSVNYAPVNDPNASVNYTPVAGKFLIVRKGKKNYYIIKIV